MSIGTAVGILSLNLNVQDDKHSDTDRSVLFLTPRERSFVRLHQINLESACRDYKSFDAAVDHVQYFSPVQYLPD